MENNLIYNKGVHLVIITPLYNARKYISHLFDALLSQTVNNFTHYIYDDGSPDPIDDLVNEYIQKVNALPHPYKVIFEKGKNAGVDFAYQHCFKRMQGSHFLWIDQDDWVIPSFVETITNNIALHPDYDVFHCNSFWYPNYQSHYKYPHSHEYVMKALTNPDQYPFFVSRTDFFYNHFACNIQTYRSLNPDCFVLKAHDYGGFFFDSQTIFEFIAAHKKMFFIKKPISCVYDHSDSLSRSLHYGSNDLSDKGRLLILQTLEYPQEDIDFFLQYEQFLKKTYTVRELCLKKNYKQAKTNYCECKRFIKDHHLPSYYFINKKSAKFFNFASHLTFIAFIYRKLRRL